MGCIMLMSCAHRHSAARAYSSKPRAADSSVAFISSLATQDWRMRNGSCMGPRPCSQRKPSHGSCSRFYRRVHLKLRSRRVSAYVLSVSPPGHVLDLRHVLRVEAHGPLPGPRRQHAQAWTAMYTLPSDARTIHSIISPREWSKGTRSRPLLNGTTHRA